MHIVIMAIDPYYINDYEDIVSISYDKSTGRATIIDEDEVERNYYLKDIKIMII